jgi:starch synthase
MRILMVTSELAPIAKVGGLADAVAALAKTLGRLGHDVTVALPRYKVVEEAGLMLARRLVPLKLPTAEATTFDGRFAPGVQLLLLDVPGLFDRDGIYDYGGQAHPDNLRRFGVFCQAVAAHAEKRAASGEAYDVIHLHDWHAALAAPLLAGPLLEGQGGALAVKRPRTVLTIHNAAHQGLYPLDEAVRLGFDAATLVVSNGVMNALGTGVAAADVVTTVSTTYARELASTDGDVALADLLRARTAPIVGITNGVDYATWSPSTDPHLVARYDAEDSRNKGRCKASLLAELEMSVDPALPLFVVLGRVSSQKGSDLLAEALPLITRGAAQIIVAGEGDPELEARLVAAVEECPDAAIYLGHVTEAMTHRLLAAADAVLMPSRFEPCGLVQLYAQRYGAAPIVRATGGLLDTVVDCDASLAMGTGFVFDDATGEALAAAAARATSAMRTARWGELRRRMMRLDRSWERPARQYLRLYQTPSVSPAERVEAAPYASPA